MLNPLNISMHALFVVVVLDVPVLIPAYALYAFVARRIAATRKAEQRGLGFSLLVDADGQRVIR